MIMHENPSLTLCQLYTTPH